MNTITTIPDALDLALAEPRRCFDELDVAAAHEGAAARLLNVLRPDHRRHRRHRDDQRVCIVLRPAIRLGQIAGAA